MIKYRLRCADGHEFDSWFRDSETYEKLEAAGQLECAVCGTPTIRRAIMAPALKRTDKGRAAMPPVDPAGEVLPPEALPAPASTASAALAATPQEFQILDAMRRLKRAVKERFEDVGKDFPEEARKIYHGESEERGIYGEASRSDAEALWEDGITILPLPDIEDDA